MAMDPAAVITRERLLLQAVFARDTTIMAQLMADHGLGVDAAMGQVSQVDLIGAIHGLDSGAGFEMDQARVVRDTGQACVLVYRLRQWGRLNGVALPPVVWCTSVWSHIGGRWQAVFHQETPDNSATQQG